MYNDENENSILDPANSEEHKEEVTSTNFIMREPESEGIGTGSESAGNESARTENARTESARVEGVRNENSWNESARTESTRTESARTESARTESARTESAYEKNETPPEYRRQEDAPVYSQQPYRGNQGQPAYGRIQPMGQNSYQGSPGAMGSQNDQGGFSPMGSQGNQNNQSNQGSSNTIGDPNMYRSAYGYQQPSQNQQPYGVQQGIPHFQEHQYQRLQQEQRLENPKPPKKKRSFAKKLAAIVGTALVFGVVAGAAMVGINFAAGSYSYKDVEVSKAQTLAPPDNSQSASTAASATNTVASNLDVSGIVKNAMPSVVAITSKVIFESQTFFGPMQREGVGSGSGIIVGKNSDELLIVTNNHVVQGTEELKVTFIDNKAVDANVKGTDADSDLAVIAIPLKAIPAETLSKIAIANLGDSSTLEVGQGVVAIGNALGYGQAVTVGYISALNRTVQTEDGVSRDLLQTDAAINPGNSGGALLNMQGQVIGINSAKYSSTEVEGMGYAIPISKAQGVIKTLMTKKTRTQVPDTDKGYLGIQCKNIDATTSQQLDMPQGVFIYKIVPGGAASKSDLHEKDIITKFDGQSVLSYDDLTNMLKYYKGGSTVAVTVQSLDNGKYVERNVNITLDTKPAETQPQTLGR